MLADVSCVGFHDTDSSHYCVESTFLNSMFWANMPVDLITIWIHKAYGLTWQAQRKSSYLRLELQQRQWITRTVTWLTEHA